MNERTNVFDEYLQSRYQDQVSWYEHMATFNKKLTLFSTSALVVVSALLPVGIASLPQGFQIINLIGALVVAMLVVITRVFRFEERWVNYRSTVELLKREKLMFDTRTGEYAETDYPEGMFVHKVESFISRENTLWLASMSARKHPRRIAEEALAADAEDSAAE